MAKRKLTGFDSLGQTLGIDGKTARTLFDQTDLDGDERASLAAEFGLDYDGPGGVGRSEFERGLAKLRAAVDV